MTQTLDENEPSKYENLELTGDGPLTMTCLLIARWGNPSINSFLHINTVVIFDYFERICMCLFLGLFFGHRTKPYLILES